MWLTPASLKLSNKRGIATKLHSATVVETKQVSVPFLFHQQHAILYIIFVNIYFVICEILEAQTEKFMAIMASHSCVLVARLMAVAKGWMTKTVGALGGVWWIELVKNLGCEKFSEMLF